MSKTRYSQAMDIFSKRSEIVEKFINFDSDRFGFIEELRLDSNEDFALIVVYLIQIFERDKKETKKRYLPIVTTVEMTKNRILNILSNSRRSSLAVIKNKLKNLNENDIIEALSMLEEDKLIYSDIRIPLRGKSTKFYEKA